MANANRIAIERDRDQRRAPDSSKWNWYSSKCIGSMPLQGVIDRPPVSMHELPPWFSSALVAFQRHRMARMRARLGNL
jgi:hypothetical protein